jgi:acylphosphatase
MIEMYCLVSGKVQGVAYRAYVENAADQLQLCGYVRNMEDGRVEVVAQGDPSTLKEFVEFLHEGSSLSEVEGVDVEWRSIEKEHDDFSVRH